VFPVASAPGGVKRRFCLASVCLTSVAYIGPNSRTERPRKTKIGTEHVARDSDTTFKVKRSLKGQLVAGVLNSQHAGIGATWRINTKILWTCRGGRLHLVLFSMVVVLHRVVGSVVVTALDLRSRGSTPGRRIDRQLLWESRAHTCAQRLWSYYGIGLQKCNYLNVNFMLKFQGSIRIRIRGYQQICIVCMLEQAVRQAATICSASC